MQSSSLSEVIVESDVIIVIVESGVVIAVMV